MRKDKVINGPCKGVVNNNGNNSWRNLSGRANTLIQQWAERELRGSLGTDQTSENLNKEKKQLVHQSKWEVILKN